MTTAINTRRQFVKNTTAGLGLITLPWLLNVHSGQALTKKNIVCVGGHPDDPESGCGGTLAKLSSLGHNISIIYLTTGEAGINGVSATEAAKIRKQEAIDACKILNAKPIFAGQVDGDTVVSNEALKHIQSLISDEKPDVVFTHWPIDSHKDHLCASLLTVQSWVRASQKFSLYFFEVCTGEQTMGFNPTDFVDITEFQQQKKKSVFCHVSQDPPGIYACGHAAMEDFRGRELGVAAAEAFVRMNGKLMGGFIV